MNLNIVPHTRQRGRRWCFTYQIPVCPLGVTLLLSDDTIRDEVTADVGGNLVYCIMQREVSPTTGRHHMQGYLCFNKQLRFRTVKDMCLDGAHWEIARGSLKQNIDYCSKEESRAPNAVPIEVTGCFYNGKNPVRPILKIIWYLDWDEAPTGEAQ